jgi:phosphoribosyl-AMP cyclohydrolase
MSESVFEGVKARLKFDAQGLIPAIIQDLKTQRVLTLCYMNELALKTTLEKGFIYLFRRSQNKLMMKGETSGHTQAVEEMRVDCEGKSLLFLVNQNVAGCHQGYLSCYFERISPDGKTQVTDQIIFDPKKVY